MDREIIINDLVKILKDLTSNWERGFRDDIGPETCLIMDLALESIQLVHFIIAVEKHFNRNGLPFQKFFMSDERDIRTLKVSDLADFLHFYLNA